MGPFWGVPTVKGPLFEKNGKSNPETDPTFGNLRVIMDHGHEVDSLLLGFSAPLVMLQ